MNNQRSTPWALAEQWHNNRVEMEQRAARTEQAEAERDAAIKRAEAAVSALRLATGSKGSTTVIMSLEVYEMMLDLQSQVDRYGADQWRRGNAGKEPQEFDEWRREQP